ncbi:hypothetical protein ABPG77_006521 [Micractinium sp. CCAP 211/92]
MQVAGQQQQQQQQQRQQEGPSRQRQPALLANQQVWAEIEAAGTEADKLERSGQRDDAIQLLTQTLARLEQDHAADFDLVVLRQMLWDALYAAERHREALVVAAQVFSAVQERFGNDSAELQLVAVRLGISSAACGRLEAGLKLIYDAAPVLQHNLSRMVEQAQAAAAQGGLDEQAAATLQETVDKLAAALGEANFYGSVFTIRHAAATQRAAGVVEGWQELQAILVSGFASLVAIAGGPDGSAVANALREHDRLAYDMGAEPLLARLVKAQNEWLHEVREQGSSHPIFQQIASAQLGG